MPSNLANSCLSVKSLPGNGAKNIHMIVYRALGGRKVAPPCSLLLQAREKLLWLPGRCIVITSQGGGTYQVSWSLLLLNNDLGK